MRTLHDNNGFDSHVTSRIVMEISRIVMTEYKRYEKNWNCDFVLKRF